MNRLWNGGGDRRCFCVLMGSAALAVTIAAWRQQHPWHGYAVLTVIFVYTTIVNIAERPAGITIAAMFIAGIVVSSLISRVLRSMELRVHAVRADERAERFLSDAAAFPVRIIANQAEPDVERRPRVHVG